MSAAVGLEPTPSTEAIEAPVLILGAGPAGLAVGACLKKAGIEPLILEKANQVGSTWHRHYRRLHLHTARRHSSLPLHPLPPDFPTFPSRQQVVDYLEDYSRTFDLRPRFGTQVARVRRSEESWELTTDQGLFRAGSLVMATGYNRKPYRPSFVGMENFGGTILHSSEFQTGADFTGRRVLVVGCGNSGAEIALDLAEHGAIPSLVVRRPIHVTPRELLGTPSQTSNIRLSVLPVPLADFLALAVLRWVVGDLSSWGILRPKEGPNRQIWKYGRVPLIDVGTIDRIKDGTISVKPGVQEVGPRSVRFTDGEEEPFDALVLATGYRTALGDLLEDAEQLLNSRGQPHVFGEEAAPGLFFVGYRNPPTGALREISLEAPRVARAIAQGEKRKRERG
ncbi:MAG: NAD(P)/FAD-dependent oxidoreductase [Myxococcota bacterium]|nr:NAD(P)/FAD-dependent oxidoreductase [Myxococcota bacterium]